MRLSANVAIVRSQQAATGAHRLARKGDERCRLGAVGVARPRAPRRCGRSRRRRETATITVGSCSGSSRGAELRAPRHSGRSARLGRRRPVCLSRSPDRRVLPVRLGTGLKNHDTGATARSSRGRPASGVRHTFQGPEAPGLRITGCSNRTITAGSLGGNRRAAQPTADVPCGRWQPRRATSRGGARSRRSSRCTHEFVKGHGGCLIWLTARFRTGSTDIYYAREPRRAISRDRGA